MPSSPARATARAASAARPHRSRAPLPRSARVPFVASHAAAPACTAAAARQVCAAVTICVASAVLPRVGAAAIRAPLPGLPPPQRCELGWGAACPEPRCLLPPPSPAAGGRLVGVGMKCAPGRAGAARGRTPPASRTSVGLRPSALRGHNVPNEGRGPVSPLLPRRRRRA
eukprot:3054808-Pleurochrysis_carterae.AAC.2